MPFPRFVSIWALATTALGCGGSTEPGGSTDAASDVASDTASDSGGTDGGATCFDDAGTVPSVPFKVCENDSDCITATHTTDCCGSSQIIGVNKSQAAAFAACEKPWDEHFPGCGCAAGPPKTDDGKTVTDPTTVVVKCADRTSTTGICKTTTP